MSRAAEEIKSIVAIHDKCHVASVTILQFLDGKGCEVGRRAERLAQVPNALLRLRDVSRTLM